MKNPLLRNMLTTVIALYTVVVYPQKIESDNSKIREWQAQVKHLDEFIGRFNYQKDFRNEPIDNYFREKYPRERVIHSLFNLEDSRFETTEGDSNQFKLKSKFIKTVIDNNLYIMKDERLFALLTCRFLYNDILVDIDITMKYEKNNIEAYYWVVHNIESELFNFNHVDDPMAFIPPNNDELGFMKLQQVFNSSETPENYTNTDNSLNQLSVFLFLLKQKKLVFKEIQQMDYKYLGIDGWEVIISKFDRSDYNSGWLISDLRTISD